MAEKWMKLGGEAWVTVDDDGPTAMLHPEDIDAFPPMIDARDTIDRLTAENERLRVEHEAYRPEVAAEIAVQLTEDADWPEIAKWCGGRLDGETLPSGDYSSWINVGGERAGEGAWITLGHDRVFRVRWSLDGPERADLVAENERLREAIRAHKREFYGNVNYDDAPTANDEALWAAIEDVAPTPPQPRNGGLLSCGCWAYVMPGMRAGRDTFECPRHGRQIIDRCNVDEPSPSTGEDGGHG